MTLPTARCGKYMCAPSSPNPNCSTAMPGICSLSREERQAPKRLAQFGKQIVSRTIHPSPVNRRRISRRNLPELIEPTKVIQSHVVAIPRRPPQPLNPPFISSRLHHVPAVKRISPPLPSLAEEIRRHAGHYFRLQVLLQPEKFAVHPDVGAVVIYEDGNVAHDANRAFRAIPPQRLPLFVKGKLQRAADLQVVRQLLPRLLQRSRFALRQPCRPFIPARQFLLSTQRVEQNEIIKPP